MPGICALDVYGIPGDEEFARRRYRHARYIPTRYLRQRMASCYYVVGK